MSFPSCQKAGLPIEPEKSRHCTRREIKDINNASDIEIGSCVNFSLQLLMSLIIVVHTISSFDYLHFLWIHLTSKFFNPGKYVQSVIRSTPSHDVFLTRPFAVFRPSGKRMLQVLFKVGVQSLWRPVWTFLLLGKIFSFSIGAELSKGRNFTLLFEVPTDHHRV